MGESKTGRVLGWLLCTLMILHTMFGFPNLSMAQSFSDTKKHWAEQEIKQGVAKGWINGYPDGSFQPDRYISRAEMASLFQRAGGFTAKEDATQQIRFTDVAADAWYADIISEASTAGILEGYEDGSMRPNQAVSRQEAAVMMVRMAQLEANETAAEKFNDALPAWSKGQIGASAAAGWIEGYPNGSFRPHRLLTRAEAVVMLGRFMQTMPPSTKDHIFDTAGTYGPEEGRMSVEGNVVVDAAKVTLQNMDIDGNLIFTDKLGEGDAVLQNVDVAGTVFVHGGGEHSIFVRDSSIETLTVDKKRERVRILASGHSVITNTSIVSSAILEESEVTDKGFEHVMLSAEGKTESEVWLRGNFDKVTMTSPKWELSLQRGSINHLHIMEKAQDSRVSLEDGMKVDLAIIDSATTFLGKGMIKKAELKVNGILFERNPESVSCVSGASYTFCKQPNGSSGGSSSPRPSVKVTGVMYEPQQVRFNHLGQEIQAKISAQWNDGTKTDVTNESTWSSQDPAVATVSGTGVIRAIREGQTNVEAVYRGFSVQIPVEVMTTSPVTDAYKVESHLTESTPVAGESSTLRLVVQRSDGSTDAEFNGRKKVAVSGFSKAPDGTIGQWNGVFIGNEEGEYDVDFTNGVGNVNLILHHAEAQTIMFTVEDVIEPEARQIVTPSPAEAQTATVETQPSLDVVSGEPFAEQPVIVLLDRFQNIATNADLTVTASVSGSGPGSLVLHGTTVIPAMNGIASFTDLSLQGRGTGVMITFIPTGLDAVNSYPISVRVPFAGGSGTIDDPYQVATAEQLNEVRYYLDAHFLQMEDIDLSTAPYSTGEGWEPLGEGKIASDGSLIGDPFTGTFDGGGKTIQNLTVKSQRGWSGLFGHIRDAELRCFEIDPTEQ